MKSKTRHPSFEKISEASRGDSLAIKKILNHYDPYISAASSRTLYDQDGNVYVAIDSELKGVYHVSINQSHIGV